MLGAVTADWQHLLDFWFGELVDGLADAQHRERWFTSSPAFDQACREQFADWLAMAADGRLDDWQQSAHGCLAFIVLTDQLPRNIYRGSAEAFAWDAQALQAARQGIERRLDLELALHERAFFYMPFEHSEAIVDQHLAVGLFTGLRDASAKGLRSITGDYLRFAQQHRDLILRFGRFPHRNDVLGRTSSAAERAAMADSDGFGQRKN